MLASISLDLLHIAEHHVAVFFAGNLSICRLTFNHKGYLLIFSSIQTECGAYFGPTCRRAIQSDLFDDNLEKCRQFGSLLILDLELVKEARQSFCPPLTELNYVRLQIKKQIGDLVDVLLNVDQLDHKVERLVVKMAT